jgi:predicted  nucleic acid-binding Zn-ribbon protein
VIDPLFWLGLSILLVAASLTAVLVASIPALQELARAARSAEKFFDTLSRELPPTLNAIRNTSLEITDLTDDVSEGVKSAGQVVKQFDQSLNSAKKQAENIQVGTRGVLIGIKAALISFNRKKPAKRSARTLTNQ